MDGCNTWEYQRFRSHKPVLNRIIIDDLTEVAEALHKEVLINDNNSRKARNQYTDAALRATELTQILLDGISLDKQKFYTIGKIFNNMNALEKSRETIFDIFYGKDGAKVKPGVKEQEEKQGEQLKA